MGDYVVTPFIGIDNVSPEPVSIRGALRDAVNVDIDRQGSLARRPSSAVQIPGGATSVHSFPNKGFMLFVQSGNLMRAGANDATATTLGLVADTQLDYVDLNDEILVVGLNTLARVGVGFGSVGVEHPAAPLVAVDATAGGFAAGLYGVAITFIADDGEESAASDAVFVTVPENGGVEIAALPIPNEAKVRRIRIYRTPTNGDVFYAAQEVALPHSGAFLLNPGALGRACDTRHKTRMRPGQYSRLWRGRLVVGRGRNLYFSEPLRYGLHDTRHGFVQFPTNVTMIEPVDDGFYIGQGTGVLFLRGDTPDALRITITGAAPPIPGTSLLVDGTQLSGDFVKGSQKYAVWLGLRGYAVGDPTGGVVEPQAKRLTIPSGQRGRTILHERRLVSVVS